MLQRFLSISPVPLAHERRFRSAPRSPVRWSALGGRTVYLVRHLFGTCLASTRIPNGSPFWLKLARRYLWSHRRAIGIPTLALYIGMLREDDVIHTNGMPIIAQRRIFAWWLSCWEEVLPRQRRSKVVTFENGSAASSARVVPTCCAIEPRAQAGRSFRAKPLQTPLYV